MITVAMIKQVFLELVIGTVMIITNGIMIMLTIITLVVEVLVINIMTLISRFNRKVPVIV